MSLYAMIRNAWDPISKAFRLSASTIEMEGHLDGNLCRCTGYKPILEAAKTFIAEDLKGKIVEDGLDESTPHDGSDTPKYIAEDIPEVIRQTPISCGRPGGCCRDRPARTSQDSTENSCSQSANLSSSSGTESGESSTTSLYNSSPERGIGTTTGTKYGLPVKSRDRDPSPGKEGEGLKTETDLTASPPSKAWDSTLYQDLKPYVPSTELVFPPALRKFEQAPICYGDSDKIWFRPTSLAQLLTIKSLDPSAKLVGGSSEVQIEVRFKASKFAIMVYIGDVGDLIEMNVPETEADLEEMTELIVGGNTTLTDLELACKTLAGKLGQRGQILEACRKQLRYFAGRQIRNAASLAGNIATASPISDMNPVLMASGATIVAMSKNRGEVMLPMATFFTSYRKTSLPADAVITKIRIPIPPLGVSEITKAYKQAKRKDDDIAIVTAAFKVRLDDHGKVENISMAYGGMAPMTVLARKTQEALVGQKWHSPATLQTGLKTLRDEFNLNFGVPGGMATYRVTLALSFFFRFWHEVLSDLELGHVDKDLIDEIHRGISSGTRDNYNPHEQRVIGKQIPHLSALKQNTGEAEYIDDIPYQSQQLYGAFVFSQRAHAKLVEVDWSGAIGPGLAVGYVDKNDLTPTQNCWGSIKKDEPFFANDEVHSHGQVIGLVYAETAIQAQKAARLVKVVYEDLPTILTIDEAIEANSFLPHGRQLRKGAAIDNKMEDVFAKCDRVFEGTVRMGGQEHFYLETNAAMAVPHTEDGSMDVWSSTQNT